MLCKAFSELINNNYDVVLLIAGNNEDKCIFEKIRQLYTFRPRRFYMN